MAGSSQCPTVNFRLPSTLQNNIAGNRESASPVAGSAQDCQNLCQSFDSYRTRSECKHGRLGVEAALKAASLSTLTTYQKTISPTHQLWFFGSATPTAWRLSQKTSSSRPFRAELKMDTSLQS